MFTFRRDFLIPSRFPRYARNVRCLFKVNCWWLIHSHRVATFHCTYSSCSKAKQTTIRLGKPSTYNKPRREPRVALALICVAVEEIIEAINRHAWVEKDLRVTGDSINFRAFNKSINHLLAPRQRRKTIFTLAPVKNLFRTRKSSLCLNFSCRDTFPVQFARRLCRDAIGP